MILDGYYPVSAVFRETYINHRMNPKIHYVVRHPKQITNEKGNLDFEIFEKHFIHNEPIKARIEAFQFYENYQEAVKESRRLNDGKQDEFSKQDFEEWLCNNPEKLEKITLLNGDAEVRLIKDDTIVDEYDKEITIHYTVEITDFLSISSLMLYLDKEYSIYEHFEYNTQNECIKVPFWDYEIYYTYAYERNIWKTDIVSPQERWFANHNILKTPFDWTPYKKENWWEDPEFNIHLIDNRLEVRELKNLQDHENLISGGESETVEFKPVLFSSIPGTDKNGLPQDREMRYEIAQVICSFLNKSGGNIYIGVSDKGVVNGTALEQRQNEDEYIRHFSQFKNPFFGAYSDIMHHYISGKFETIRDKRVFVITVRESKHKPVFLFNKNNKSENKSPNEFYIREGTSSKNLYDPKQMVDYIAEKWWTNKR